MKRICTVLLLGLLTAIPGQADPAKVPRKIRGKDVFVAWRGFQPVYFCEYVGTPSERPGINKGERVRLIRGVIGISRRRSDGSYALVTSEVVETRGPNYRHLRVNQQFVGFDRQKESARRLRLKEKAPLFSLIGERSTYLKLNKRKGTGKIRMKFWHGGRFLSQPYSDETRRFRFVKVKRRSGSAGAAGALSSMK